MKIKFLTTVSAAVFLALAANGQAAHGGTVTGAGTGRSGTPGGTGIGNSAVGPAGSSVDPANPNPGAPVNPTGLTPSNPNGNTPVVGGGLGPNANNTTMGTNNLAIGTNMIGIGSNNFSIQTNGFNSRPPNTPGANSAGGLAPTGGTNSNIILIPPN